jgi:GNAT superfamily N-acetyltransferase
MTSICQIENFKNGDEKPISLFVREVYDEFVAPDNPDHGNNFFYDFIKPKNIRTRIKDGTDSIFLCKADEKIVAVLSIRSKHHISLLFVDKSFQGRGIAGKLIRYYMHGVKEPGIHEITVHASPYSTGIYERLGFSRDTDWRESNGIRYQPMRKSFFIK